RPRPVAAGAGAGAVDGDLGGESVGGVLEADAQIGLDVRPALGAARPATEAEDVTEPEPAEEVLQILDADVLGVAAEAARPEPAAGGRHAAHLVVLAALLRVGQHRVGLRDLLEPLLGARVVRV